MCGVVNPNELAIDRSLLLYWKAYFELELSEWHTKEEYYFASILQAIYASAGVKDVPAINDLLIKIKSVTQIELDEEQKKKDLAFFEYMGNFSKNLHNVKK
jgi:hypothetical protein